MPAEDFLGDVEQHFNQLVAGVQDYAIFLMTPNGNIKTWNAGAQKIKGYAADEIIGEHFSRFYPPEAIATGWPDEELILARQQGRFEDEGGASEKMVASFGLMWSSRRFMRPPVSFAAI